MRTNSRFCWEQVDVRGYVDLHPQFREDLSSRVIKVRYLIVDVENSYYVLLERPSLNALGVIISKRQLAIKLPSNDEDIITIHVICALIGIVIWPT